MKNCLATKVTLTCHSVATFVGQTLIIEKEYIMSRSRSIIRILATSLIGLGVLAATGTAQADPPPWAHGGWHRDWHRDWQHGDDDHGWRGGFFPPPPPAYYPPPPVYYAPPPPPPVYYAPPPPPPVYYAPPVVSFGINVPLGGDNH
jgi:hypothetical protein